jgi:hypothetical protein
MTIHICDYNRTCTLAESCSLVADSSSLGDGMFRHYTKISNDECEPVYSPWKQVFNKSPIERSE